MMPFKMASTLRLGLGETRHLEINEGQFIIKYFIEEIQQQLLRSLFTEELLESKIRVGIDVFSGHGVSLNGFPQGRAAVPLPTSAWSWE
jgi:hypothetical protein